MHLITSTNSPSYTSPHCQQLKTLFYSLLLHFSRIHQFAVILDPVEHQVLSYATVGRIAMVGFHEVDDFTPFFNSPFILGHNSHTYQEFVLKTFHNR